MTFLALNGTTIPCLQGSCDQDAEESGVDRARMFDGTMRVTRRYLARKWSITTNLLTPSDADAVLALVNQGGNLIATGDLVESSSGVYVLPVPGKATPVQTALGLMRRLTFVLEENPTPFVPDTSAVVYTFYKRNTGLLKNAWVDSHGVIDYSACIAAGNGDLVSVWQDQSGNNFHLLCGANGLSYDARYAPTLDGDSLRLGNGSTSGGHDGSSVLTRDSSTDAWWPSLTRAEIMISVRATNGAPGTDGRNQLWNLNRSGGSSQGNTDFPKADGHIYEPACSQIRYDYGALTALYDLASLTVYDRVFDLHTVSPNVLAYLNNTLVYSDTNVGGSYPYFDPPILFGIGENSGFWDGWYRDLVIFNAPLTDSQRLSWYRYMIGLDAFPPI